MFDLLTTTNTTVSRTGAPVPTAGYAVALYGISGTDIHASDVYELAVNHPDAEYLGSWVDPATGVRYVDIVAILPDLTTALAVAREHFQIAIYDLAHRCDIRVDYPTASVVSLDKGVSLAKRRPVSAQEWHVVRPDGSTATCHGLKAELARNDLGTFSAFLTFASVTGYHYFSA